jgi:hypothetical protein
MIENFYHSLACIFLENDILPEEDTWLLTISNKKLKNYRDK